jgi:putative exosortase-associated protein (TIGR04073 family)
MKKMCLLFATVAASGLLFTGCAGPEKKLGRGLSNTFEVVRWGEMRRSVEQTQVFDSPDHSATTGVVKGFSKTLARTGMGILEVATFPLPPYGPQCTSYLSPLPGYPDSYRPGARDYEACATDNHLGFSGGEMLPWIPGNRFKIFDHN